MAEGEPNGREATSAFNPVFGKLVGLEEGGQPDLQGLVAYGLYKIAKREWASDIATRHGRKPSEDELEAYMRTWTPSQLKTLQERAAQVLAEYADTVIQEEEPRILQDALRGSFWRGVWPSMLASFFYTLLLIGIALILAVSGIDFIGTFRVLTDS